MDRRELMRKSVQALGALVAGVVGLPALILASAPVLGRRRRELWVPVGALEDFPVGGVAEARVRLPEGVGIRPLAVRAVYVWRPRPEEVVVFSRRCTDLSCPVTWDPGSTWFFCPCHGGIFSIDGTPRAGPPNRPLYRYELRIREGSIEIDLGSVPPMA